MIVTELETNSDDSLPPTTNCTVMEFNIDPEPVDDGLRKMYEYYVVEDDGNEGDILEDKEGTLKEYKSESFTKTFKTLVDIVVEPHDECLSSSDSEASEDLYSTISRVSKDFITQTTNIFIPKNAQEDPPAQEVLHEEEENQWKLENLAKWF